MHSLQILRSTRHFFGDGRAALLLFAGLAAACGGGGSSPPVGQDAGPRADASPRQDAGPPADAGPFEWPVPTAPISITPSSSWKNEVSAAVDEPFRSRASTFDPDELHWIKFVVLMRDPSKVYYQDSVAYPFHYEFATERLDPFSGMSRSELDLVTLHEAGQEAILGAVLFAPLSETLEYGVQLVRQDAYHPEMVRIVFELVAASVMGPAGTRGFYFPTFEQAESAKAHAAYLAEHGVQVSSPDRWLRRDSCYAPGWAIGKLIFVPGDQIDDAYAAGTLGYRDILITDGVPAEVPYLSGVISLSPSTPSSHVAILSQAYGTPFAHPATEAERTRVMGLAGREVLFRVSTDYFGCDVRVIDVDGELTDDQRRGLQAMKDPPRVDITPKAPFGMISASAEDLGPADVRSFGGKAANFGVLRDAIPERSPRAVAFSFDLFDAFLGQTVQTASGPKTLRSEISDRLSRHTHPPEQQALRADLAAIRALITESAVFEPGLRTQIEAALAMFDASKNIRFRSSSNAEDGVTFTGAGLYDSYSGCLADDRDADEAGPSICDPTETKERGVYRALRKVYASFYNDNAFMERLRHGIPEDQVAMGVLVHHSHPDTDELANGVATLRWSGADSMHIDLVTQLGAVSVTNPEGGARPELVGVDIFSLGTYPTFVESSSLVPLGGYVLDWDREYVELSQLLATAANRFAAAFPGQLEIWLDFEYKKMKPGVLVVKQIRQLPIPNYTPSVETFLIDEGLRLCTEMSELTNVFANHRLKTIWTLHTKNMPVTAGNLAASFYEEASLEWVGAAGVEEKTGALSTWPGAAHRVDGQDVVDEFTLAGDPTPRTWGLRTHLTTLVAPSASPVITLRDGWLKLDAQYSSPQPDWGWDNMPVPVTSESSILSSLCPDRTAVTSANIRVENVFTGPRGISVTTSYYFPEPPRGATAGYTAPLYKWEETRIEGLTTEPIVLRGFFSQTYKPQHHNFAAEFIFEPRLEPGISAASLAELEAADIRYLFLLTYEPAVIRAVGRDGTIRALE